MRVRIKHVTRYGYPSPAALGPQVVRLRPAEHARARLLSYNQKVTPEGEVRWQQDPWGNHVARVTYPDGFTTDRLEVEVDAAFEIRPVNPFDFFIDDRCQSLPFAYPDGLREELAPFLETARPGARLAKFLEEIPPKGYVTDHLVALNQKVAREVRYVIRNEPGIQSSEETLERGLGSCRDSARLLCDALRAQGLAARFVSGYLVQLTDEGNIPDEAKGVARDVVDLHAWAEVYIPGAGWIGLDGTSGLLCNEGHIPLACTVNPDLAAPIDGTASEPAQSFEFEMGVARLGHEPRPRKPYTDEQWAAMLSAGEAVDRSIERSGVKLTVGGEPTWTSRKHPREPEWTTEALGVTKWKQGLRMAAELLPRLGQGALAMHRFGKHYPGESLPRWVLHLLWRADGETVWGEPGLLDFAGDGREAAAPKATLADAERFGRALAARLGVSPHLVPGYEDPVAHVLREANLPDDVDPKRASLDDPEERRTLSRVLTRGLGAVVGYALPLALTHEGWASSVWSFRRGSMFLLPGDSPMGLRLPLDRLSGSPLELWPQDMTAPEGPLSPTMQAPGAGASIRKDPHAADPPEGSVRTALCVEEREGVLHVFLPPAATADAFLELVSAVEATARELGRPVRLEGYPPPPDPRLRSCLVTPDPGCIEVNLPVTERFADYASTLATINDAANHAGLSTEKYQLDGREVGSGGGNHVTLGGPTTLESPFLTRPRLLAGLLRYAQTHPSLSYFFTGLFVGPTSQAPRVDEARHDSLYELEIALERIERAGDDTPPWFVDRALRNLLCDVAGNTHRTEICIDKLFDPHTAHGRQGILEFRAFEMPPHEQMAAAQVLLLRSLVAMLLREPCERPLVRWGTELHDRFLLPHYLWADLREVLADVRRAGFSLDDAFYQPFLDYRFPVLGTLERDGLSLELRPALEPWPVLGEQATGATVSRYVDSSLERLQVLASGLTEGRHEVLVNGHRLPLRPTGKVGERVAGVRFRAWQPPHCLHPHIGVHHPVRFDLVDTWGKRSLGACSHHVWHPDGRAYDDPPLTAFEAAARRAQRFTTLGHAPFPVVPAATTPSNEQPYTLDLRRYLQSPAWPAPCSCLGPEAAPCGSSRSSTPPSIATGRRCASAIIA